MQYPDWMEITKGERVFRYFTCIAVPLTVTASAFWILLDMSFSEILSYLMAADSAVMVIRWVKGEHRPEAVQGLRYETHSYFCFYQCDGP